MNAGYVRLSRDDDRRNYVSIENQKLILRQYAADRGASIDRWYEDDGISGYLFDRPGFQRLMADLDRDIDTVYVKDFSRLGRHNAKILLLLDEFQERGKRLLAVDDHYDSMESNDDMIGIQTWFNERYVKDTSRKIKGAIGARQKAGTLITRPPFGYRRNAADKTVLEIVPREAELVRSIYRWYLSGLGYRRIAERLTALGTPTPSMMQRERELSEGRLSRRAAAAQWSDRMVKGILDNDFYTGTLRLRKRSRNTVHGTDKRVPREEQFVFENHHPPIIDREAFALVQETKETRNRTHYRGSRRPWTPSGLPSPFGTCLFCADCKRRLTPIRRRASGKERSYYICSSYNSGGPRGCGRAHLIREKDLTKDVLTYIRVCRNALEDRIAAFDPGDLDEAEAAHDRGRELSDAVSARKKQLKILLAQKAADLAAAEGSERLIGEAYDSAQRELTAQIRALEIRAEELGAAASAGNSAPENALETADRILSEGVLERRDVELLIDRIDVDENGMPRIRLKYGWPSSAGGSPAAGLNAGERKLPAAAQEPESASGPP